ncbi:MAG TPA: type II secretion system protein GspG [Sedimentisphaerales bacterium]|nr:type II secretion system protein GspG [Sedimentisphaerales bacterium]
MFKSRTAQNVVAAAILVLFSAAQSRAQEPDILSGRDLLRAVRDSNGLGLKPAYETRLNEPMTLSEPAADEQPDKPAAPKIAPRPAPASTVSELLRMIPSESLFCVRVNNLDFTLSQIDQFLAGVSPMPMGTSVLVRTQLAGVLGSPEIKGVNMSGSFAFFGPLLGTDLSDLDNIALLVPVTDYEQFVSGNPNVSEPDERGISKITSEGMHPLLVTQAKTYALVTPQGNDDELLMMAKAILSDSMSSLSDALEPAEAERAGTESIWAYGNVQEASKTFGPQFFGFIEQAKQAPQSMEANRQACIKQLEETKNTLDPNDPAQKAQIEQLEQQLQMLKTRKTDPKTAETLSMIMDMYAALFETLMNETKSVSLMLTPKPDVLYMTVGVSAMPGTCIADLFTTDVSPREQNKFLPYLEDGAVMNFATSKFSGKLNAKGMEFFVPKLSETLGVDKEKFASLASDVASVFSGSDAMSFSVDPTSKPSFVGRYVMEISDKAKLNKVIEEGIELFNTGGIARFYEGLGMKTSITLKRRVGEYNGVTIDAAEFAFQPTDPNSPQGQMMAAMYGGGINYRWATIDGLCLLTLGGDADASLRKLIDLVKAGGPKELASETKAALALLPDAGKADFVGTFNVLRYFKIFAGMMGAMMPVPMPQMDLPTSSNVVIAGHVGGGAMTTKIALPKQHLTEIMTAVQMMMQQKMKMQQERITGQEVPPQTDRARVIVTKLSLKTLHAAVTQFYLDTGRYPAREEGLHALVNPPSNVQHYEPGGYLETTEVPTDAWGNKFYYELSPEDGKACRVVSFGADGKAGGEGYAADLYSTDVAQ